MGRPNRTEPLELRNCESCGGVYQPCQPSQKWCSAVDCQTARKKTANASRDRRRSEQRRTERALKPPEPPPPARPYRGLPMPTTLVVHQSMTFSCPDCPRTYDDSGRLDHHRRTLHDPPPWEPHAVTGAVSIYGARLA